MGRVAGTAEVANREHILQRPAAAVTSGALMRTWAQGLSISPVRDLEQLGLGNTMTCPKREPCSHHVSAQGEATRFQQIYCYRCHLCSSASAYRHASDSINPTSTLMMRLHYSMGQNYRPDIAISTRQRQVVFDLCQVNLQPDPTVIQLICV